MMIVIRLSLSLIQVCLTKHAANKQVDEKFCAMRSTALRRREDDFRKGYPPFKCEKRRNCPSPSIYLRLISHAPDSWQPLQLGLHPKPSFEPTVRLSKLVTFVRVSHLARCSKENTGCKQIEMCSSREEMSSLIIASNDVFCSHDTEGEFHLNISLVAQLPRSLSESLDYVKRHRCFVFSSCA